MRKLVENLQQAGTSEQTHQAESGINRLEKNSTPTRKDQSKTKNVKTSALLNKDGHGKIMTNKSPSDTTIYAPALNLIPRRPHDDIIQMPILGDNSQHFGDSIAGDTANLRIPQKLQQIQQIPNSIKQVEQTQGKQVNNELIQQIANFVEQVRLENENNRVSVESSIQANLQANQTNDRGVQPGTSGDKGPAAMLEEVDQYARNMVLQAERFRAKVKLPQGMVNLNQQTIPETMIEFNQNQAGQGVIGQMQVGNVNQVGISDDEFFHLTCYVEANLKHKIEKGEYVELEKLLHRVRFKPHDSGQRLELINRGGETFIVPADKGYKIMNVRHWEQAFRIYVAIYSNTNPHRAAEIWQYVL